MPASSVDRRRGRMRVVMKAVTVAACSVMAASCASESYQSAAMEASESGDQKTAINLAKKEVARFAKPDQCSRATNVNCGTLALAYGTLAGYQIMDGDSAAGEMSFGRAKGALGLTDSATKASATGMVYRDVSEAFWKVGNRARATAVLDEGRAAGADEWLYMASAARAAHRKAVEQKSIEQKPIDPPPPADPQPIERRPIKSP